MIEKAIKFACKKHEGQLDKASQPYIYHLLRVMINTPGDQRIKSAAVLHDIFEDTNTNLLDIIKNFGKDVAAMVCILTRNKDQDYFDYINKIINSGLETNAQKIAVMRIKKADLEDNMNILRLNEFEYNDFRRMNKYVKAHRQICEALKCT